MKIALRARKISRKAVLNANKTKYIYVDAPIMISNDVGMLHNMNDSVNSNTIYDLNSANLKHDVINRSYNNLSNMSSLDMPARLRFMTRRLNYIKITKNCAAMNKMHTKNNIDAKPKKRSIKKKKRSYARLPDQLVYNYYWQNNNK